MQPTFRRVGEETLLIQFENTISLKVNDRVQRLASLLLEQRLTGINDCIPAFRSLAVDYNPLVISHAEIERVCMTLLEQQSSLRPVTRKHVTIPVHYGGVYGPDLEPIAATLGLTPEDVVRIHVGVTYTVYMIGFLNGFAYMGDTDDILNVPRRHEPRLAVPAGSIAIAMKQTGIYPLTAPSGWHILGRTPLPMFDHTREPPGFLLNGDRATFRPVSAEEYDELERQVQTGASYWDQILESGQISKC